MKMKAEIRVMLLQVKDCQRLPAKHKKLAEKPETNYPSEPSEGTYPADTLILDFYSRTVT